MLTLLGLGMIICFMYLIMSRRMSPLVALTLIPVLFALLAWSLGFYFDSLSHIQLNGLGEMMLDGVKKLAPTGIMLLFAILYFAIMIDTGLFDPSVKFILKMVKGDPLKVILGTITLTIIVSLDGDGSTTYMICVAAMLPLYKRLDMSPLIMACLMMLASGIMNLTPWGRANRTCSQRTACRPECGFRSDDTADAFCNRMGLFPGFSLWPHGA